MMQLTQEMKDQIVSQLKTINPERIIVFGSYAYGKATKESDLDICVVEKNYNDKFQEKAKIRKLLHGIVKVPIDILNPTLEEYNFYKNEFCSVYKDIEESGEVLWSS